MEGRDYEKMLLAAMSLLTVSIQSHDDGEDRWVWLIGLRVKCVGGLQINLRTMVPKCVQCNVFLKRSELVNKIRGSFIFFKIIM